MNKMTGEFTPDEILKAWIPFRDVIGFSSVRTMEDHEKATKVLDQLLDIVGNDEKHPLADVLDFLGSQIEAYEDEHVHIPDASPAEMLMFLMEQHKVKQSDLVDCMPASRVSEILNGKRGISKNIAKILAKRFNVSADVFI